MSRNAATADDVADTTDGWMTRLGPKLRSLRKDRALTLEAVADRAGLTKGFLSLVERGQTTISVPNLLKVCEILGVSVGSLFDYPESPVVRSGLRSSDRDGRQRNSRIRADPAERAAPAGDALGAQARRRYRRRHPWTPETIFVFVVRGCLRLTVEGAESLLKTGDSYTFSARAVHSWDNPGEEEAEVLWSIVPPIPRAGSGTAVPATEY